LKQGGVGLLAAIAEVVDGMKHVFLVTLNIAGTATEQQFGDCIA
jgi:hypothetical protein